MMFPKRDEDDWVVIFCPVCKRRLGDKKRGTFGSFECKTDGCSKTKHFFFPGQIKRPGKSVPWHSYVEKKSKCGKFCCDPEDIED